ncbi:histidine ammonia-lyase [Saccharicrinis fermentans]|uniref:Histidine ammonia-lyase n=1 Tax=Saccharicrinis fermentans DSM 9555 = JCM 21142 TaxID=869213 RepID=W7Y9K8_9BACT|nr:histidine ammonia-lyase [Saccharicrinis fermentans]GAF04183.1 histidine ammonia-lyase [Saccharicrinis fermentans DSM 9555 = JCM 21142]
MENKHYITPQPLTFEKIDELLHQNIVVELSEESKELIQSCKNFLDDYLDKHDGPVYGINTGFGALHNKPISKKDLSKLQKNLLISHACGAGNEIPREVVRSMLLLKAHALSMGKSGVQLQTVQRILDFYNHQIYPVVLEQGSLGASGDLAPLAHLFLPLIGYGEVFFKGKTMSAAQMLKMQGWKPITLEAKEGLALLNGTQFMSAHAVYTLLKTFRLSKYADIIAALSIDAFNGRIDPFKEQLHVLRPHPGQLETAKNITALLQGSEILNQANKQVQDPYSFRCVPQVHGAIKDAINYVAGVVYTEINSVTDNPIVFPDEEMILSGGNFHGEPLALALDFLSIAMAEIGSISERRTYRLISGERDLPEFLVANPGLNSGFMIPQYAAASIVSLNKQMATPSSVDSIPSSNEQEDHVSMGGNAATKALKIAINVERVLAVELLNAAQAIEFRRPMKTSPYLEGFLAAFRAYVPFVKEDKIMYKEMEAALEFLNQGEFDEFHSTIL